MRRLLVVCLVLAPALAGANRYASHAMQRAALGCWDVGEGVTLEVRPFGKHSIRYRASFARRPRGGPAVMEGDGVLVRGEYDVQCRPRSQHGGFCRISGRADGTLHVRVFRLRHGAPRSGQLVEERMATRCKR